jgi:hypothetical protein
MSRVGAIAVKDGDTLFSWWLLVWASLTFVAVVGFVVMIDFTVARAGSDPVEVTRMFTVASGRCPGGDQVLASGILPWLLSIVSKETHVETHRRLRTESMLRNAVR